MAPVAITSQFTSPPGVPLKKSQIAAINQDNGVSLDGSSTPYSTTSTAVSESGSHEHAAKVLVEESLPKVRVGEENYYTHLIGSSAPVQGTKPGSTVYGSAIDVLEAFAVQNSEAVWVYDDAEAVGFGSRLAGWTGAKGKVFQVQTREGAGLELAGYSAKATGQVAVFATTATLPYLADSLSAIQGDIVIHLATTAAADSLELKDSLFDADVLKTLTNVPEGWEVIFSAQDTVETAAKLYGEGRKVIHVVESTHLARETSSYTFPSISSASVDDLTLVNADATEVYVVPNSAFAAALAVSAGQGLVTLNTLTPSPDALFSALTGESKKTVHVVGGTKSDADALKSVVLGALYSASASSKAVFPTVKSLVSTSPSDIAPAPASEGKTVAFYTAPLAPLPQLLAHLFLSSPSLVTRLAAFGSSSTRGLKSVLSLSPAGSSPASIAVDASANVTWVSDANVLKSTNILANAAADSILVLELPWTEEEVPVKLTRSEIATIKEKNIRVFLLDLDSSCSLCPIKEQVAFLLLYTGSERLPAGVRKVLDAFHGGELGRDEVEEAQAGLFELDPKAWSIPELEEGKVEKAKAAWEWDALPTEVGLADETDDASPALGKWDLAARHLLFREAFAVPEAKVVPTVAAGPSVSALRPSMEDETFLVTVSENRRLTPLSYDRNVFHLELDTSGTGLKYEIGEAIGIHGWNDTQEILDFIKWYGLEADALVSFPNPQKAGTIETRTVFQLLQQNVDLFGRPGKAFYAALAKLATTKADAMTLKFISAPEGAELFKRMAEKETVTFADVLYKFRTARPSIEELVGLIPEIKPRHYSIASSQKAVGDKVELLIVTVDWIDSKGELLANVMWTGLTNRLAAIRPMHALPRCPCPRRQGDGLDQAVRHEAPARQPTAHHHGRSRYGCGPLPRLHATPRLAAIAGRRGRTSRLLLRLAIPIAGVPVRRGDRGLHPQRDHLACWSRVLARRQGQGVHPAQDEAGRKAARQALAGRGQGRGVLLPLWTDLAGAGRL
jgi:sulfite reductase (NADPH) flavoprotein alpha-component